MREGQNRKEKGKKRKGKGKERERKKKGKGKAGSQAMKAQAVWYGTGCTGEAGLARL
jgi:hypothetical protein